MLNRTVGGKVDCFKAFALNYALRVHPNNRPKPQINNRQTDNCNRNEKANQRSPFIMAAFEPSFSMPTQKQHLPPTVYVDKSVLVFILSPEKCSLPEIFKRGRVVGINLSNYVVGRDNLDTPFGAEVCRLIDYIINETDLNILLIPHVLWKGQDDRIISQEVINRYKSNRLEVLNSELLNYEQIRYVISQCHLFIGARTHAVISAYATCTPAIAIGYSVKSRGIAKDLGLDETLIVDSKVFSRNQLLNSFCYALEHETEIRLHLESVIPAYVKRLYTLKERFADSIKKL